MEKSAKHRASGPFEKRYFTSIQILRGVAALSIVLFHVSEMLLQYTDGHGVFCRFATFWYTGAAGVDLFFVISGFVMVQSTQGAFGRQGAGAVFMARRIIRIVPLYWMYTVIMLLLVLLPFTLKTHVFSASYTIKSLLFIPAINPTHGLDLPLLPQGWTLSYEMYFYLLFTLLLFFEKRFFLPVITAVFLPSALVGLFLEIRDPLWKVVTSPLLLEYVFGCYLGRAVNHRTISRRGSLLLIFLALFLLFQVRGVTIGDQTRLFLWGLPAMLLAAGCVFLEKQGMHHFPEVLVMIGNSSYSIYLSHIFVVLCAGTLAKNKVLVDGLPNDLFAAVVIALCILTGYLSFTLFEQPISSSLLMLLSRWGRRKTEEAISELRR